MTKKIIVALDNSEISKELVRIGDSWAQRSDAELCFLHVGAKDSGAAGEPKQQLERFLESLSIASAYQIQYRTGTSYLKILELEKEFKADLIIMGAHRHTMMGRLFLGSNTKYVLHHCRAPVYVHKQQKLFLDNKIVVPIDYTEVNKPVIQIADEWAQRTGAELYFIRVDETLNYEYDAMSMAGESAADVKRFVEATKIQDRKMQEEMERQEEHLKEYISSQNVKAPYQTLHKFGEPYRRILGLQEYINAGLIMMAAHSHTTLNRLIAGSNTDYLLHHATCPMYVYKE
ncbi:MAG: universal stress protein [SAR324 cluster bacterium]|nr:universal stress protein [SAR324 cluster bacterium]